MNNNEKAIALNPTTPIVEKQPQNQTSNNSIPEQKLTYNGKVVKPLETIDGKTLFEKDIPPLKFVINKILPQGLFILARSPKVGKSWLSLDFCQTVATGGQMWDYLSEKGTVLYLALEDSLARLQSRLKKYTKELQIYILVCEQKKYKMA